MRQVMLFNSHTGRININEYYHAIHLLRNETCDCDNVKSYNGKLPFYSNSSEYYHDYILIWPNDIVQFYSTE